MQTQVRWVLAAVEGTAIGLVLFFLVDALSAEWLRATGDGDDAIKALLVLFTIGTACGSVTYTRFHHIQSIWTALTLLVLIFTGFLINAPVIQYDEPQSLLLTWNFGEVFSRGAQQISVGALTGAMLGSILTRKTRLPG